MPDLALFAVAVDQTETDERFTPAWVFDALGESFDLDPAAPEGGGDCVPAYARLTRQDDGLLAPWSGFVWLNPPFSNATPWADRFIAHGNGVFLGPVANAAWVQRMVRAVDRVWLMRDFAFTHPTHAGRRSSMPLFMVGAGYRAAAAIDRAALRQPDAGTVLIRP